MRDTMPHPEAVRRTVPDIPLELERWQHRQQMRILADTIRDWQDEDAEPIPTVGLGRAVVVLLCIAASWAIVGGLAWLAGAGLGWVGR